MTFCEIEAGCRRESWTWASFFWVAARSVAAAPGACRGTLRATRVPQAIFFTDDPNFAKE